MEPERSKASEAGVNDVKSMAYKARPSDPHDFFSETEAEPHGIEPCPSQFVDELKPLLSSVVVDRDLTKLSELYSFFCEKRPLPLDLIHESGIFGALVSVIENEAETGYEASSAALRVLAICPAMLSEMMLDLVNAGLIGLLNEILAGQIERYARDTFIALREIVRYTGIKEVFAMHFSIDVIAMAALKCLNQKCDYEIASCLDAIVQNVPIGVDAARSVLWIFQALLAKDIASQSVKNEETVFCLRGIVSILDCEGITLAEKKEMLEELGVPVVIRPFLSRGVLSKAQILAATIVGKMYALGVSQIFAVDEMLFLLHSEFLRPYRSDLLASLVTAIDNMEHNELTQDQLQKISETLTELADKSDYRAKRLACKCFMRIVLKGGAQLATTLITPTLLTMLFDIIPIADDLTTREILHFLETILQQSIAHSHSSLFAAIQALVTEHWPIFLEELHTSQRPHDLILAADEITSLSNAPIQT